MRRFNSILLVLGSTLLAVLIWTVGPAELWRELRSLGWGLIPFVLSEGAAEMVHTLGWRHCLTGKLRSLNWFLLFRIRMAGYAINYLTPTASLGGEVTKTSLLASHAEVSQAASGVLIGKVCFGVAHILFVALGAIAIVHSVHLPLSLWITLVLSALLVGCGIVLFLLLQKHGKLGAPIRWLASKGIGGAALDKLASNVTAMDEELRAFHCKRPADMCLAVCWHLLGYSIGIAQTWFFLHLVQPPASLTVAAAVWFLGMWFDLLTFAIPLNAGSLEGSRILSFKLLSYAPALGLAYGIALRLAQIFWAATGLVFYGEFTARKGPPNSESETNKRSRADREENANVAKVHPFAPAVPSEDWWSRGDSNP